MFYRYNRIVALLCGEVNIENCFFPNLYISAKKGTPNPTFRGIGVQVSIGGVPYSMMAASRISFMTLLVRTLRSTAAVNSAST